MNEKASTGGRPDEEIISGGLLAEVVEVVDRYNLVINRGTADGVKKGQVFLVYSLQRRGTAGVEGRRETEPAGVIKGTGEVVKAHKTKATLRSTRIDSPLIIQRRSPLACLGVGPEIKTGREKEDEPKPFVDPEEGDTAELLE